MLLTRRLTVESVRSLEDDYVVEKGPILFTLRKGSYIITFKEKDDVIGIHGTFDYLYRIVLKLPFGKFSREVSNEVTGSGYVISKSDLIKDILEKSREVPIDSLETNVLKEIALRALRFLRDNSKVPEIAISVNDSFKTIINNSSEVTKVDDVKVVRNKDNIVLKTGRIRLVMNYLSKSLVFKSTDGTRVVMSGDSIVTEGTVIKRKSLVTRNIVAKDENLAAQEAAKVYSKITDALEADGFFQED
ncbi:MAG: hypothetical protein J7J75_02340 [Euryarchaeota archaeon]|nr:hypothetical protein [Euryarchaeota archaeon]MCD6158465.1 hypothetical protein [Euryarchaeota archaeon]